MEILFMRIKDTKTWQSFFKKNIENLFWNFRTFNN